MNAECNQGWGVPELALDVMRELREATDPDEKRRIAAELLELVEQHCAGEACCTDWHVEARELAKAVRP